MRLTSPSSKRLFRSTLPWISTGAIVAYLIWETSQHEAWNAHSSDLIPSRPWWLVGLILAMPLNWLLESWKWHRLLQRTGPFADSFREVLIGSSWAFITPNRAGDVVARVALLPKESRTQGTRAFLTGAFAQMWITLFMGPCAWWVVTSDYPNHIAMLSSWTLELGLILSGLSLLTLCVYLLWKWPLGWNRLALASSLLHSEPVPLALRLETLLWSALRFLVFAVQFFAALLGWGISLNGLQAWYVPLVYLGNMIIPSAALSEMGTREALTIALFQPDASQWWAVVLAAFSVWLVNLGVPALAGTALSFRRQNRAS
jgi:hypothetical protein